MQPLESIILMRGLFFYCKIFTDLITTNIILYLKKVFVGSRLLESIQKDNDSYKPIHGDRLKWKEIFLCQQ
ncbi:hypothetical protein L6452_20712 [Arctium lappa]|uniref:Uncharacterized protein n=1 Tax=Arctium lappa TaxID=4217 RepID=A0ACB9BBM2_ARCLA|nr:hypothetical protein L6452_20712 [Arctium lappa]